MWFGVEDRDRVEDSGRNYIRTKCLGLSCTRDEEDEDWWTSPFGVWSLEVGTANLRSFPKTN